MSNAATPGDPKKADQTTTPTPTDRPPRVGVAGRRDYPATPRRDVIPVSPRKPTNAPDVINAEGRKTEATEPGPATADATTAELTADRAAAELAGAELAGAELTGAELTGAERTHAGLTGAELRRDSGRTAGEQPTLSAGRQPTAAPKAERHIAEQRVEQNHSAPDPDGEPNVAKIDNFTAKAEGRSVPEARLSNYAEEAAELLAAPSANRKRRQTAAGLPAGDPAAEEPPITVTRLPRKGQPRPTKD